MSSREIYACYSPSSAQVSDVEELVKRSKGIYYAVAIKKSNYEVYEFEVIDNLRAKQKLAGLLVKVKNFFDFSEVGRETPMQYKNVFIKGTYRTYKSGNYNNHKDEEFWTRTGGRVDIDPDCSLKPTFKVGLKYLLFVDEPYHFKSFEEVNTTEDRWFKKVNQTVNGLDENSN